MKTKISVFSFIAGLLLSFVAIASATPVTYLVSGVGSGRLGTSTFSNEPFTITSTANTSQIMNLGGLPLGPGDYRVIDLTTTIFIAGLGLATFTDPLPTIDDQTLGRAGDRSSTGGGPVLTIQNAIFDTYNLATSLGPVGGEAFFGQGNGVGYGTSDGNFIFSSVSDATFQAVVPDRASTFGLLVLAVLALGIWRGWQGTALARAVSFVSRRTSEVARFKRLDTDF